jgi:arabinofuranosyltransferase
MSRWGRLLLRVAAGLVLSGCVMVALRYVWRTTLTADGQRVFTLWDDAMISMRYAHNLATGHGLVWNPGERVQGYSNLGLTLVMAVLHLVPVGLARVPLLFQLASLAAAAGTVIYAARLARVLVGNETAAITAAVLVATLAPLGIWAAQGSDTAPIALVTTMALYHVLAGRERGRVDPRAFVAAAAGIVIRLDFALLYVLILAFSLWTARNRREVAAWGVGLLAGTVGALLLFAQLYYGDPLPNTFYLKATGVPARLMLASGWQQLRDHARGRFAVALLVAAVYLPLLLRRGRSFLLLYALLGAFAVYFVRVGGDWVTMHPSRFLVPAIPVLVVILVAGSWRLLAALRRGPALAHLVLVAQVPALIYLLNRPASAQEWLSSATPTMYHQDNQASLDYARLLARTTRPDATVGVFWAGVLPYHLDRVTLDLLGRADRHIAHAPAVPAATYWPGHAKRDWQYVVEEKRPDILISDMPELRIRDDYRDSYCRAVGAPRAFIIRKDSADRFIAAKKIQLCHVAERGDACPVCGREGGARPGPSLFDFESGSLVGWERAGDAFGPTGVHDARAPLPGQQTIVGVQGRYLVNSYHSGDTATGILTSPEFTLEYAGLSLLVGGGNHLGGLNVALMVDGAKVAIATGRRSEELDRREWRFPCQVGKRARLVITDQDRGAWGHVLVDDVRFQDVPAVCAKPARSPPQGRRRRPPAGSHRHGLSGN